MDEHRWYGVKCIVEHRGLADTPGMHVYEERIIVLRTPTSDDAIIRAELDKEAERQLLPPASVLPRRSLKPVRLCGLSLLCSDWTSTTSSP
jgi:hypothetical protein